MVRRAFAFVLGVLRSIVISRSGMNRIVASRETVFSGWASVIAELVSVGQGSSPHEAVCCGLVYRAELATTIDPFFV
jgi:hypothetical protein